MSLEIENRILEVISDYEIYKVPKFTRFWMIRTKNGYFYKEFITKGFVALAWNLITEHEDFSGDSDEYLKNLIRDKYEGIERPKTVINKCNSFINGINEGDILVIPSAKSKYITIARAGYYYEDDSKTYELEKSVISRIESKDLLVDETPCPYKKRRNIEILTTVKSTDLHSRLSRAITNYHGISNLDDYATYILNLLYPVYSLNEDVSIVFNIRKEDRISPRSISGLIYGVSNYLQSLGISDSDMSTQIEVNSPGQIVIFINKAYTLLKDNGSLIAILLILTGGGSFGALSLPGIPGIIKNILMIRPDLKNAELTNDKTTEEIKHIAIDNELKKAEIESKNLNNYKQKLEIAEKIKALGIDPEDLDKDIVEIVKNSKELQIQPVETLNISGESAVANGQDIELKGETE